MTHAKRQILVALYCVAVVFAAQDAARHAEWNFDVVGYTAAAIAARDAAPDHVHERTYAALRRTVSRVAYDDLTKISEYRRALLASSRALATQVPFYTNKPAYVGLVRLVTTDYAVVRATYLVSVVAYLLLAALCLAWTSRLVSLPIAALVSGVLMLSSPMQEAARLSTPDLLAALLLSLASFAFVEFRQMATGGALLAVACGARPDSLVMAVLLLAYAATDPSHRTRSRTALLLASGLACVVVTLAASSAGYSWGTLMKHTFVHRLYSPGEMSQQISFGEYLTALVRGLSPWGHGVSSWLSVGAFAGVLASMTQSSKVRRLLCVAVLGIFFHYLLFPALADRFFLAAYVLVAVAVAATVALVAGPAASATPGPAHEPR